jgi:hypothetical protein
MTARPLQSGIGRGASWVAGIGSDTDLLRTIVVAGGIVWSILFVAIGLRYELQMYGDGAMFSYSVAAQDAWAFHWHNISGRVTVYLLTMLPAEAYVGLTRSPDGGIVVYGLLFFSAPLLGLIATFLTDRSKGRIIFAYACFSTACLCPLVFGFLTEMWIAHALFWPALAVAHYATRGIGGTALLFTLLLALALTHEGALVLVAAIVGTALLWGTKDRTFRRAAGNALAAIAVWAVIKLMLPPDGYFSDVLVRAGRDFFGLEIFTDNLLLLLFGAIAGYGAMLLILARLTPARAHIYGAATVAVALVLYWLRLDHALHAANRYYLRTMLVLATPVLGGLATIYALQADGRLRLMTTRLPRIMQAFACKTVARAVVGAFVLVMLVHAVETAKFVAAWADYKTAVTALATSNVSDPALGDANFVSSDRIGADLNRMSWYSTTPYLSAIMANFAPTRLVVDPRAKNYFWLSCETATANLKADRAIPAEIRRLVRTFSCLHR